MTYPWTAPLSILLSGALLFCGGCSEEASRKTDSTPKQGAMNGEDDGSRPPGKLPMLQVPRDPPLSSSLGERDLKNHYLSAVIVKAVSTTGGKRHCSGVLIDPRLVLTTGHCLCAPREDVSATGQKQALIDSTSCPSTMTVATVTFSPQPAGVDRAVRHYQGEVHPHPKLKVLLNGEGKATSSSADLAVIFLNEPVADTIPVARLAEAEVKPNDSLVHVGYNHTGSFDENEGMRLFGKGTVSQAAAHSETVAFEPDESTARSGDEGGPCFLEREDGLALVGVAARSPGQPSVMTSTFFYREWLLREIQRAHGANPKTP